MRFRESARQEGAPVTTGRIEARIAALRGQVRRLLALHGLGRLTSTLALAVLAAGLADWLLKLVPEVRLTLLVGLIGLGVYVLVRRVVLPLVVRFADLDIALRIEERWPGLNDRLASTVQFLRQDRGRRRGPGVAGASRRHDRANPGSRRVDRLSSGGRPPSSPTVGSLGGNGGGLAGGHRGGRAGPERDRGPSPVPTVRAGPVASDDASDGPRRDTPEDRQGDAVHPGRRGRARRAAPLDREGHLSLPRR